MNDLQSLAELFRAGNAVSLPWFGRSIQLSTPFDSQKAAEGSDPFLDTSPFDYRALQASSLVFEPEPNQRGVFSSTTSTRSGARSEHFSMNGDITAGNSFLGGSGSGTYNKTVSSNNSTCKSSQRASVRKGILSFSKEPILSSQAVALLRSASGRQQFRREYGDFFVSGYALGADCGIMLGTNIASSSSSETLSLVLEAHLLMFTKKWVENEAKFSSFTTSTSSATCFDSMTNANENLSGDLAGISAKAEEYAQKIASLEERFQRMRNERLQLTESSQLTWGDILKIASSNLVAEVMLQPYTMLRQVSASVD